MRVAIYSRVSTADQTVENQLAQLRQFAASQQWQIVAEFCDEAVSGAKGEKDPVCNEKTEECYQADRRVEVFVR